VAARFAGRIYVSLAAALLSACAHNTQKEKEAVVDPASGERVITSEEIAASGARTAWDVLRHYAGHLTTDRRDGSPGRLQRRGRSSIYLNDGPVVFVDGVRVPDARNLQYVPAQDIESIRIISGIEGTTHYGTNAGNGVIIIATKT
jgi:outer membrane cobalamin receptor